MHTRRWISEGLEVVTTVRRLAQWERSVALTQLALLNLYCQEGWCGDGEDPFAKMNELILWTLPCDISPAAKSRERGRP